MTPLVAWVAEALLAAWQRQEHEGRYRGADDFRALHIDPADALASWRAVAEPSDPWPERLGREFAEATSVLPPALGLDRAEAVVAALAVTVELEPRLRPLVAALTDDPGSRQPTVTLAAELAAAVGLTPGAVRATAGPDGRLAFLDLVTTVPVAGRPSPADALLLASPWLVAVSDGCAPPDPVRLAWVDTPTAPDLRPTVVAGADHRRHAEAVGGPAGRAALWSSPSPEDAGAAARAALVVGATLVAAVQDAPAAALIDALTRATRRAARWRSAWPPG